ncbi:putative Ig domain-containing protein [Brucella intermedia]|uniref:putative Ig domain-containing protein n=1 Tax=Brucella intermedia TaxID=94625 RepID=UPI00124C8A00|nr:putative Ig domain-containing protein [Brucella intermedia]KAB2692426.1 autotransporter domain-containing protein [Brucella intermedia]
MVRFVSKTIFNRSVLFPFIGINERTTPTVSEGRSISSIAQVVSFCCSLIRCAATIVVIFFSFGSAPAHSQELPSVVIHNFYYTNFCRGASHCPNTISDFSGAPPGMNLRMRSDGPYGYTLVLEGTPKEEGQFTITYKYGGSYYYATIKVDPPTIELFPEDLPSGRVGKYYSAEITARGGIEPYAYSRFGGELLPHGLTLNSETGILSGVPSKPGKYDFWIGATDVNGYGGGQSGTNGWRRYSVQIAPKPIIGILPATLPKGLKGAIYPTVELTGSGGKAPYTFSVSGLPAGLSYSESTIFGRPAVGGEFDVQITATDYNGDIGTTIYRLIVSERFDITPLKLPDGLKNSLYPEIELSASGGTPDYKFTGEDLPAGLYIENNIIKGRPTAEGSVSFAVIATDANGYSWRKPYTINIASRFDITPLKLPDGLKNSLYPEIELSASGGTPDYKFTGEDLPAGLYIENNIIKGRPTAEGSVSFAVIATDANGYSWRKPYTINIASRFDITPLKLPDGLKNSLYPEIELSASGGTPDYKFTGEDLPAGLYIENNIIKGRPTAEGSVSFAVIATDANGYSWRKPYTINILPALVIKPDSASLPEGKVGVAYPAQTLSAEGGTAPYAFTVSGLPKGLAFDPQTNTISGTPTEAKSATVTVSVTDNDGHQDRRDYSLVVTPTLVIKPDSASLPEGKVGVAYPAQTLSAEGGTAPYAFTVSGLPKGLAFDPQTNTISGTPTEAKSATVTVSVTDNDGHQDRRDYSLVVTPTLVIKPDSASLPEGKVGVAYPAQTLSAEGGTAPYAFTVSGLPKGLAFDPQTNTISGTPTEAGTFAIVITVTDSDGHQVEQKNKIVVENASILANNHELTVIAGTVGSVNLVNGTNGDASLSAEIVTHTSSASGKAWIEPGYKTQILYFAAAANFSGTTSLTYRLSGLAGISEPATVTIHVIARPDPSLDPEVNGLVTAQLQTANRMTQMQLRNFQRRLEQLNDHDDCRPDTIEIRMGLDGANLNPKLQKTCTGRRLSVWSTGEINLGTSASSRNEQLEHTSIALSSGVDYRFSSSFIGGVGFGYGKDTTDVGQKGTQSRATVTSVAAYGSYRPNRNLFLNSVIGYGWLNFQNDRFVSATNGIASGERKGQQIFGAVTLGYDYRNERWLLSPYLRADAIHTKLSSFSETGGEIYNLTYGEQTANVLSATIGLRGEYKIPILWGELKPSAKIEYSHNLETSGSAKLGYTDIGGPLPYMIPGGSTANNNINIQFGIDALIHGGWNASVDYGPHFRTDGGRLEHTLRWKISKQF